MDLQTLLHFLLNLKRVFSYFSVHILFLVILNRNSQYFKASLFSNFGYILIVSFFWLLVCMPTDFESIWSKLSEKTSLYLTDFLYSDYLYVDVDNFSWGDFPNWRVYLVVLRVVTLYTKFHIVVFALISELQISVGHAVGLSLDVPELYLGDHASINEQWFSFLMKITELGVRL